MSEKLVGGVEGRPGGSQGSDGEDLTWDYDPYPYPTSPKKKILIPRDVGKAWAGWGKPW